ncbi:hypothetical protein [Clostridium fungisolvens]|uniref:Uncharacterized protein n=1 Tax=Clostridium fungisolvens TaxID=1604897 RepID=A0A6V8SIS1_9CLOT|nr:hypothetical protein [Clostridium fungisolvens]GFP76415.1 hypothetical protein bsdtw1_02517 [Clostridium fungisolvens]
MWNSYEAGVTLSEVGTENGIIIMDEEHTSGARITIEKNCGNIPFGITAGIYGLMVHTAYASSIEEANEKYSKMKIDIEKALKFYENEEHKLSDWLDEFCNKY